MRAFKDNQGHQWEIAITVDTVKRVRGLLNVDLLAAIEGDLVPKLATDPILLADVLYAVVKPQADNLGVSDEDFGRGLGGDAIEAATTALLEELVDFFPARRRTPLQAAMRKFAEAEQAMTDAATRRLESPETAAAIAAQVAAADRQFESMLQEWKQPSGSTQESSA
jgi:hypothetical protein